MHRTERKCKNPECESVIEYFENPKKLFCNASCKNRFHYLSDREENHEVYEFEKALKTNYEIAIHFFNQNIFEVDAKVAKALGFKRNVYMGIKQFSPSEKLYNSLKRIKDIFFLYDIEKDLILFYQYNEVN
ncbi:hypothetical protein [Flavobacterium sp.]|uniref:hypothetical protein n=1 Tax=Flavobacterium sp. TaxID=239 RepID=UPI0025D2C700|nr:hypothetical protein [Flavobacterium sp.]